jgi:hypothetical protein
LGTHFTQLKKQANEKKYLDLKIKQSDSYLTFLLSWWLQWTSFLNHLGTVDGQIKLGQKWQSHKSKFTNLYRLITALSQIG